MLDPKQSVAAIVLDHSETAVVFQRHRIDYCCRGERSLDAACSERGVPTARVVEELQSAINARQEAGKDPRTLSTPELLNHIVAHHHQYLREALPFVKGLAQKVSRVHGEHNPKLRELERVVLELVDALEPHLDEEEQSLFPALASGGPKPEQVGQDLANMKVEHLAVGALLEQMRNAAEDFKVPEWGCNSYRTLFSELEQLEGDTLAHVHLENHVLLPRFVAA